MNARTVLSTYAAVRDDIGDLVTRRPVPSRELDQIDPFLFLNHHGPQVYPPNNQGLPFGPHPHRGFETVTFILSGNLAHQDSGGGDSVIEAGGVQWMTAGRGIVHSEVSPASFKREGGPLEILQLWVNLPARLKFVEPNYIGLGPTDIVERELAGGVTMRQVSGGSDAPIQSLTGIMLSTVQMEPGTEAVLDAPIGRSVFFYVIKGEVLVGGTPVREFTLARLGDGDRVEVATHDGARILFGHGEPIDEPMVAHGPFVMNTQQEIVEAINDYRAGRFS